MRIFTKRKVGLIGLGIATGLALTAVVYAATFGPSRPTFTWLNTAHYITFNSITDNPTWGDERYLVKARHSNAAPSTYTNNIAVKDGDELIVTTYFHNNAASNLNLVAKNTKVQVALPTTSGSNLSAKSSISASNSNPTEVWATMDFVGNEEFTLEYVPGSAQLKTNFLTTSLSDDIVKGGVLVGTYHPNGDVKGCAEFSGYAYFKVKVHKKKEVPKPVYSCDILNVKVDKNRLVHGSVNYTAQNGATLSQVDWNWGDGIVEKNLATTANHTYAKDGTYTITTTLTFNVNGVEKKDTCTAKVTVSTPVPPVVLPETTLPKTGPGAAASVFAGASALGAVGHYAFRRFRA